MNPGIRLALICLILIISVSYQPVRSSQDSGLEESKTVTWDALESYFNDPLLLIKDVTLAPVVENGWLRGYRIVNIPQGSMLSQLALNKGDILLGINGAFISELKRFKSELSGILEMNNFTLSVERHGEVFHQIVNIE